MQCIAIEFARNVLGFAAANSREMAEKTPHNVIDIMEEQKAITNMGGTMYAKESQIIYYTVDNDDFMNQYSEIPQK